MVIHRSGQTPPLSTAAVARDQQAAIPPTVVGAANLAAAATSIPGSGGWRRTR